MQRKIHFFILALGLLGSISSLQAQLVIAGSANDPLQPELYIQDGNNATDNPFVYVQGDVIATGTTSPNVVVNGALFVDQDFSTSTPGNVKNQLTGANLRFDRQAASATIGGGNIPSILNANIAGTVHLMANGAQQIQVPDGQKVHFYNLNLANDNTGGGASVQDRTIPDVGTVGQVRVTVGTTSTSASAGTGTLFLSDDRLNTKENIVEVLNNAVGAIQRDATGSAAFIVPGMHPSNQLPDNNKGMVTSTTNGRLGRLINGGQSYLFPTGIDPTSAITVPIVTPIGTSPLYRPALTDGGTTSDVYYVAVLANTPTPITTLSNAPGSVNQLYYWRINTSVSNSSPTNLRLFGTFSDMTATYDANNCLGSIPDSLISNLSLAQAELVNISGWQDQNGSGVNPGGSFMPYAESSAYSSIDDPFEPAGASTTNVGFTLSRVPLSVTPWYNAGGCDPFPASNISLTAVGKFNLYIDLDWSTTLESNGDKFEVQRSTNGANFSTVIGLDKQANGIASSYTTDDHSVVPNVRYYYRIRKVGIDGAEEFSNIASAILDNSRSSIGGVYPNPTNGDINVDLFSIGDITYRFSIYNAIGQVVLNKDMELTAGENTVNLNLTNLAMGTYELVVKNLDDGSVAGVIKVLRY